MYQSFDMYEMNMAEIARQQFDLESANATLTDQQDKLSLAEQEMIAQQIKLNSAQSELDDAEAILAAQKDQLSTAQSLLDEKEDELAAQKEKLDSLSIQLGTQQSQISSQQQQLDNQQAQLEQLVGVRTQIITELSTALRAANISATVDPTSGAIALESDVLFTTGASTLSQQGKSRIDEFLPVYLNVLFSSEYKDYISEIIIEGHTDSDGGYIMNLDLSQQRAFAVASYVLGDSYNAISNAQTDLLRKVATANGRSYSDRIFTNGVENKDASRRVVFKFRMTDEDMIEQMKAILENQQ